MTSTRTVQRQLQQQPTREHDPQWMQQQCTKPQAWALGAPSQQMAGDAGQHHPQQQGDNAHERR